MLKSLSAQNTSLARDFMLSGGGSSIAEKPIDNGIFVGGPGRNLPHAGALRAPIAEINAIRKHLSAIKGGRLARQPWRRSRFRFLVSDVP